MPIWVVKATWIEDETEANEQWEVDAARAEEAVQYVTTRMRYPPHHVEARRLAPDQARDRDDARLNEGQTRHIAQR